MCVFSLFWLLLSCSCSSLHFIIIVIWIWKQLAKSQVDFLKLFQGNPITFFLYVCDVRSNCLSLLFSLKHASRHCNGILGMCAFRQSYSLVVRIIACKYDSKNMQKGSNSDEQELSGSVAREQKKWRYISGKRSEHHSNWYLTQKRLFAACLAIYSYIYTHTHHDRMIITIILNG